MRKSVNRIAVTAARPPLLLIRFAAGLIYRVFFASGDARAAKKRESELAELIMKVFSFLFNQNLAKIAGRDPTLQFPPPFDYATVCVVSGNLMYRFIRGREEEHVSLQLIDRDERWHELSLILNVIDTPERVQRGSVQDFRIASACLIQFEPNRGVLFAGSLFGV